MGQRGGWSADPRKQMETGGFFSSFLSQDFMNFMVNPFLGETGGSYPQSDGDPRARSRKQKTNGHPNDCRQGTS